MAKKRAGPKKGEPGPIPCGYGGISYGDKTVRLGLSVSLGNLTPAEAVRLLVGQRLKVVCTAVLGRPDQPTLTGDTPGEEVKLTGTADVRSIGVNTKAITFGLTFPTTGFDEQHELPSFAKRPGFFTVLDREDIPEEAARLPADGGDDEGDDGE